MNLDKSLPVAIVLLVLVILASGCVEVKNDDNNSATSVTTNPPPLPPVKAKITDPYNGQTVKNNYTVHGTFEGEIPANSYLWLLVGEQAVSQWWPQGGGSIAPIVDGKWAKAARIGGGPDLDIGKEQQMIVMLVDEKVNKDLTDWVEKGKRTNDWPGIGLPSGKVLDMISVVKGKG